MRSSRLTFLFCLLLSAAVHAALFWQLPRWGARDAAVAKKPPPYHVAPPGTVPDPPAPRPETRLGEAKGVGDAINSSSGDVSQSAPKSNADQAVWTRDSTGNGPGEAKPPTPPKPLTKPIVTTPPAALPTPPVSKLPAFKKPPPPQPKAPPAEQPKPNPPTPPQPPPSDPTPQGGRPLPHSDQDSDAFAKEVTVEFKRGKVTASNGRQIKFTRPRINIAAMVEGAEIMLPARLRIRIDVSPDGSARNVTIVRTSGSPSIDRAFLLAAYESWFEPAKDTQGIAVADVFEFNISIQ